MPTSRRKFLAASTGCALMSSNDRFLRMLAAQEAPAAIKLVGARPRADEGAACGDVGHDRAIIWSRCDRPARMLVEWDASDRFTDPRGMSGPSVIEATDFTGKIDLRGLPAGQRVFYRVRFEDLRDSKNVSEPIVGNFVTPPRPNAMPRDVKIAF